MLFEVTSGRSIKLRRLMLGQRSMRRKKVKENSRKIWAQQKKNTTTIVKRNKHSKISIHKHKKGGKCVENFNGTYDT